MSGAANPMDKYRVQFNNNSQLLDMAAKRYQELSATQNMTLGNGRMKGMPFEVAMVSGNETLKVNAYYKPWVNTVHVNSVEAVALTPQEIESIKNPAPETPEEPQVQQA